MRLRADGVPGRWIAEDVGFHEDRIYKVAPGDAEDVREWRRVWGEIKAQADPRGAAQRVRTLVTVVLPVPLYPYPPTDGLRTVIRRAKDALASREHIDFKIQVVQAFPGEPMRVLSAGGLPPFVCDVLQVKPGDDMVAALEWVLDDEKPLERPGVTTKADYLRELIGAREITTERQEAHG